MDYLTLLTCIFAATPLFLFVICIILGKILSAINNMNMGTQSQTVELASATAAPIAPTAEKPIPNRTKIVVAVSAAIAEELGTDVSAIKIVSLKKL